MKGSCTMLPAAFGVLLAATAGLAVEQGQAPSSSPTPAFTVGQREYIDSTALKERREIFVSVPSSDEPVKLPLLVILDAEWSFRQLVAITDHLRSSGRLPPVVVVGIVNRNRGRDMLPAFEGSEFAASDSAGRFLTFIADELLPLVEKRYPVGGFRILAGHSNAGAFTLQALARRPEAFHAYLALSPSSGDDRLQALLARSLARPGLGARFLFLGVGDEEADIAVGTTRFAKTIEQSAPPSLTYRYAYFPGESHSSVTMKAYYRGLELLGEPDPPSPLNPGRYLSEQQRRERAWRRRFGSGNDAARPRGESSAPLPSVTRPILDRLAEAGHDGLRGFWDDLRQQYGDAFRFDPVGLRNLLGYLESAGRRDDADALRRLPGFVTYTGDAALNNYGSTVDVSAGLAAHITMEGVVRDLAGPSTQVTVQGAVPCADRHASEGRARRFDGKGSQIIVAGNPALSDDGSLTVAAWIRPRVPVAYTAWVSQVRSVGWGSKWRLGFGTAPGSQWGATTLAARWTDFWTSGTGLPVDQWVHTAAVFDQTLGSVRLFMDGRLVGEFWGLPPWASSRGPLLLGAQRDDGVFFDGDVGEVRVYKRTLNAAEVEAISALK